MDENFVLFNHSIPIFVSCVLLRDYFTQLSEENITFCKDLILDVSVSSLNANYRYQLNDGLQESFSILPLILDKFPDHKNDIKFILLMGLFNEFHIGGMLSSQKFSAFPILAIHELWATHFDDAQSLLLGYMLVKPRYDHFWELTRHKNYKKGIYDFDGNQVKESFLKKNKALIEKILDNKVSLSDLDIHEEIDLHTLNVGFRLILPTSANQDQKAIVKKLEKTKENKGT